MIKFITTTETPTKPTLKDVKINQFFINAAGHLCQKRTDVTYIIIAKNDGRPYADIIDYADESHSIRKILPHVEKIEF